MKGIGAAFGFTPKKLNQCYDVWDLAGFLGTDYDKLSSLIYSRKRKYRHFVVKKKSGAERHIFAPTKELKSLQYNVKSALEIYYKPRNCAHGFIRKKASSRMQKYTPKRITS